MSWLGVSSRPPKGAGREIAAVGNWPVGGRHEPFHWHAPALSATCRAGRMAADPTRDTPFRGHHLGVHAAAKPRSSPLSGRNRVPSWCRRHQAGRYGGRRHQNAESRRRRRRRRRRRTVPYSGLFRTDSKHTVHPKTLKYVGRGSGTGGEAVPTRLLRVSA
jgi:hypothetical protein